MRGGRNKGDGVDCVAVAVAGLFAWVERGLADTGVTVYSPPPPPSPDRQVVDRKTGFRTKSVLCVPVRDAHGEVIAVAQAINRRDGDAFTTQDKVVLMLFCRQVCCRQRDGARGWHGVGGG